MRAEALARQAWPAPKVARPIAEGDLLAIEAAERRLFAVSDGA